ncbi:MAG TPA: aminotransferase class V-fold PLP-dependent enzyme, partial [Candidatus Acidoferrales bacterium]|nr:aminotransferase class V-fold PLP-dependent enzyme [Candidatus Acidoferrales bacterium]
MIYFDYNATAPVMREAREAWLHVTEKLGGNPSSMHQFGTKAAIVLADAREKLAAILGCHPLDLVWTSGATEANNMVMHHFAKKLPPTAKIFVSSIEHPCVDDSSKHYFGKRVKNIPVTHDGVIDMDWLTQELAEEQPGLVTVMAANNETGII